MGPRLDCHAGPCGKREPKLLGNVSVDAGPEQCPGADMWIFDQFHRDAEELKKEVEKRVPALRVLRQGDE